MTWGCKIPCIVKLLARKSGRIRHRIAELGGILDNLFKDRQRDQKLLLTFGGDAGVGVGAVVPISRRTLTKPLSCNTFISRLCLLSVSAH